MEDSLVVFGDDQMAVIPIHFDVPGHDLPLSTFIETAQRTEAIIAAFNKTFFDNKLEFQLRILPPKRSSFLSELLPHIWAGGGIVLAWLGTPNGQSFFKGLTSQDTTEFFEELGKTIRKKYSEVKKIGSNERDDDDGDGDGGQSSAYRKAIKDTGDQSENSVETTEADKLKIEVQFIISEMVRHFLQKNTIELEVAGFNRLQFREAYEARNSFYESCLKNQDIKALGFDYSEVFPIGREHFEQLRVDLTEDDILEEVLWDTKIETILVSSPNWDREDQSNRGWKGKNANGSERIFRVEDDRFWELANSNKLTLHTKEKMKVQLVFEQGSRKNRRALRVIEFNDQPISKPMSDQELREFVNLRKDAQKGLDQGDLFTP